MSSDKWSLPAFKMPLILIGGISFLYFAGNLIPVDVQQFFYSISLSISVLLKCIMPFIICGLLLSSILTIEGSLLGSILLLIVMMGVSNFAAIIFGYGGICMVKSSVEAISIAPPPHILMPLWKLSLTPFISNQAAMLTACISGGVLHAAHKFAQGTDGSMWNVIQGIAHRLGDGINKWMQKCAVAILPLLLCGYAFKLQHEKLLQSLFSQGGGLFAHMVVCAFAYALILWLIATGGSFKRVKEGVTNIAPALGVGFATMSSMAAMSLLMQGSIKNTGNKPVCRFVLPVAVNMHSIGCSIISSMEAVAIMLLMGAPLPSLSAYAAFAFYFSMAKFATVAIPGGIIIIIVPILEAQLGFTPEMTGLLIMLDMMMDCFITTANLVGNGAFVMIFNNITGRGKEIKA